MLPVRVPAVCGVVASAERSAVVGDRVEVVPDGDGGGEAAELAQVEVGGAGGVDKGVQLGVAGGEPGGKNVEETDSKEATNKEKFSLLLCLIPQFEYSFFILKK